MLKYNPKNWVLIFTFKGSLFKKLTGGIVIISIVTIALCILHLEEILKIHFSNALPGYMGAALGLLLVFRNNVAYDKWWEARKEIGALVNVSRGFAISLNGLLPPENKEKYPILNLLTAFVFALKEHLRSGVDVNTLKNIEPEDMKLIAAAEHKPNVIANIMMNRVERLYRNKLLNDIQEYLLIQKINTLVDILGKCERIRNTPIPMAYAFLLKFFIVIYVILLPLGLVDDMGWWSIPLAIILYYILMSIVLTAEEIEEPFGLDMHDLPMDEISEKIKANINEIVKHE